MILDGMGDLPNSQLDNMTPLESANTPNMDFLATRGELGYLYPVKPGFVPGSGQAIVSIFGNHFSDASRGYLEAIGVGIELKRGDLALRVNFATIDSLEKGNVLDRRAGRTLTTKEADLLTKALNKIKMPVKFEFKNTIQHRGVLIFRGGFSEDISPNDGAYSQGKIKEIIKIKKCMPIDEEENSVYTANIVNEFLDKAYEVLVNHPINLSRKEKGLMPANYLLIRGAGTEIPKLKKYQKWCSAHYMPLEIGFSEVSGMTNSKFDYPRLKKLDAYENLWDGLRKACKHSIKVIKKNWRRFDYCYIHLKETDLPGHDNKPFEKKAMIEYIDNTFMKFLRNFCPPKKIRIAITADHSTPCKLKSHSADPVPVLLYNDSRLQEKAFSEKECRKGTLRRIEGIDFIKTIGFHK